MSAASAQAGFARALLDPEAPHPKGLRAWNGSDPAQRFAVYRNNVVVSLVDGLAAKFPVVQELVGEEFFRAMARVFVMETPPASPVVHLYGDTFPAFLERFDPVRRLAYLPDVARLEAARLEAHHAADARAAGADDFAALAADDLAGTTIILHPSLRLIRSPHPVHSLWAAHNGLGDLGAIDLAQAEDALVTRPASDVVATLLPAGVADFLVVLAGGRALGQAMADAAETCTGFDPAAAFHVLISTGAAAALRPPASS